MTPATTYAGRAVALFGLGASGLATALALKEGGARVIAWDDNAEGVAKAAVNPIKLPSRFGKMIEEWRLGRNMDQIAAMVTSPDARAAFRGLLKSGDISGPVGRLATIAARSQAQAPLQITVQPRGQDR